MTLYTTQGFKNDMQELASDGFTFLTTYKPTMPTSKAEGLYFLSGKMQGTKRNDQNLIEKDLIVLDYDALSENLKKKKKINTYNMSKT